MDTHANHLDTDQLRVTTTQVMGPQLDRLRGLAIGAAVAGLVLCGVGFAMNAKAFWPAWLHGYLLWIGLCSGSLALLGLHHTVGGGWGFILRRFLESSVRVFPIMALLFLPIAYAMWSGQLYSWVGAQGDRILQEKSAWLNPVGFLVRSALYFGVWLWFAHVFNSRGAVQNEREDITNSSRLNTAGGFSLLMQAIVVTFMSVDWVMSLEPHWFSSIFGLLFAASHVLSTLAISLVFLGFLAGNTPLLRAVDDKYFRDLGNFTLALVLLWAYMAFSQYLITYSGNTTEEVGWYIHRQEGFWLIIPLMMIAFHFALPFGVLLVGDKLKRNPKRLAWVGLLILVMRVLDNFWLVTPTFRPSLGFNPADLGAPLLIGGIWLAVWATQMRDKPVAPIYDPRYTGRFQEVVEHA